MKSIQSRFNLAPKVVAVLSGLVISSQVLAQAAHDPAYQGSSFNEVQEVLEDQSSIPFSVIGVQEQQVYKAGKLPRYPVSFFTMPLGLLELASQKTLKERADYYPRLQKLVHANGICVSGDWQITEPTGYSGYFKQGSQGLFIGRISVALQETTNAGSRGFGFAGKIFPTMDPTQKVETANFFTVDILSGAPSKRFLDQAFTNDPPLIPSLDIAGPLAKIIPAFLVADSSPTFRPITQIARVAETASPVHSPRYMRLRSVSGTLKNDQPDFRNEVLTAFAQNSGQLQFVIEISNTTSDRKASAGWTQIGLLNLNKAIVSYGCDRRLHFSHPKDDHTALPNLPKTKK
jgi:hypothetical protein